MNIGDLDLPTKIYLLLHNYAIINFPSFPSISSYFIKLFKLFAVVSNKCEINK